LYSEPPLSHQEDITQLLDHIPQVITQQDNKELSDPIEESEILKSIQQMEPDKAPGLMVSRPTFTKFVGTPSSLT
jgi:hypothetical protein